MKVEATRLSNMFDKKEHDLNLANAASMGFIRVSDQKEHGVRFGKANMVLFCGGHCFPLV